MPNPPSNPQEIAEAGERIFREKYQKRAEEQHTGKFLAINVRTEEAFLGHGPEEALQRAKDTDPQGLFHLARIGSAEPSRQIIAYTHCKYCDGKSHAEGTGKVCSACGGTGRLPIYEESESR
jgi:hypothetical protein